MNRSLTIKVYIKILNMSQVERLRTKSRTSEDGRKTWKRNALNFIGEKKKVERKRTKNAWRKIFQEEEKRRRFCIEDKRREAKEKL